VVDSYRLGNDGTRSNLTLDAIKGARSEELDREPCTWMPSHAAAVSLEPSSRPRQAPRSGAGVGTQFNRPNKVWDMGRAPSLGYLKDRRPRDD